MNTDVYLTALESLFPPLMGLDNAALRSSYSSSSSKNPCEGPACWCFNSWFGILPLFDETTMALEELVVRFNAVDDEAVRGKERESLAPALATWPKKCYKAFNLISVSLLT